MRKTSRIFYFISLGALALYLTAAALFQANASTQPLLFEGLALSVFVPLVCALWLDYFGRLFRPIWLFLLSAAVSLLCAVHLFLLIRLFIP